MLSLQQFREQYPQYKDMPDQQLADSLRNKYYSDIPADQFYQKIGINNVPRGTLSPEKIAENRAITNKNFPERKPVERGTLENILMHGVAGGAQVGKNLLNIPHGISSKIPAFGEKILPEDPYDVWGVKKNLADEIGIGIADFAPYLTGAGGLVKGAAKLAPKAGKLLEKAPNLTKNVLAGAGYGGVTAPEGEKLKGTALGAGLGAAAVGAGNALDKLAIQPLSKFYAKSAIPGLIERASTFIKGLPEPEMGAGALKSAYNQAYKTQSKGINDVISRAKSMDEIRSGLPNAPFKDKPYTSYINNFVKEKSKLEPAISAKYQQAMGFAKEEAEKLAPKSIEGVVALRQNLNGYLKKYLEKNNIKSADHETKEFIKGLKNQLGEVLDKNTPKFMQKEMGIFKKDWEKWNKDYAYSQEFKKGIGKAGNIVPKKVLREGMENGLAPDAALIGQFMPQSGQTGIAGFQQLEKLLGSKAAAKQAIQSYSLRNLKQSGANTKDIADVYSKYSPEQRQYLFGGTKEEPLLEAANNAMKQFGRPKEHHGFSAAGHHFLGYGLPGMIGTGAAAYGGLPWDEAVIAGGLPAALGYQGLKHGIKKYATPKSVEKALERAEKGRKNKGAAINFGLQNAFGLGGNQ